MKTSLATPVKLEQANNFFFKKIKIVGNFCVIFFKLIFLWSLGYFLSEGFLPFVPFLRACYCLSFYFFSSDARFSHLLISSSSVSDFYIASLHSLCNLVSFCLPCHPFLANFGLFSLKNRIWSKPSPICKLNLLLLHWCWELFDRLLSCPPLLLATASERGAKLRFPTPLCITSSYACSSLQKCSLEYNASEL